MKRLVVWAVALVWLSVAGAETIPRPHIVLVMTDDQGRADVGWNGHPVLKTPRLDEAAAAGVRFDRFYAAAPVCSPTRASVLTGRHPNRAGVFQWGYPLRQQETTIAELLRSAGYVTAHFGKWHLGSVRRRSPVHPGHHGFDEWLSAPNFYDNDPILSHRGTAVPLTGESSMVTVDAAIDWLRAQDPTKAPLFAVIWFGSPHLPHRASETDRRLYADQPERLQHFYGEITGVDRAFGKLRDTLDELGLRDNTVLWFCSDNGGLPRVGAAGGLRGRKGSVYEGGLMVPAFLEWPAQIPSPRRIAMRCSTCDIFPTLLDIAGIRDAVSFPLDGISLLPWLTAENRPEEDASVRSGGRPRPMGFWHHPVPGIRTPSAEWMAELLAAQRAGGDLPPHNADRRAGQLPDPPYPIDFWPGHAAWIDGDWKLHRIQNGTQVRWELYDLKADPAETEDRWPKEPDRARPMQHALETWLRSVVHSYNGKDLP